MMYADVWMSGNTDPAKIDWTIFFSRLERMIAWYCGRLSSAAVEPRLRSPELEPPHLCINRDDEVCRVGRNRDAELAWPKHTINSLPELRGGRLLAYFPDWNLSDGAAELESQGFFDVYNMPGWDTWVAYFDERGKARRDDGSYIVAYVPRAFVSLAQAGIAVNPEECIAWLSDTDTLLSRHLQANQSHNQSW